MPGERSPDGDPLTVAGVPRPAQAGPGRPWAAREPGAEPSCRPCGLPPWDKVEPVPAEALNAWFGGCPIGLSLADTDLTIVAANPSLESLLGRGPGDLLGVNWMDLVAEVDHDRMSRDQARLTSGEVERLVLDRMLRHTAGHLIATVLTINVIHGPDGTPRYLAATVIDPREHDAARSALVRSEQHLALSQRIARLGSWELDLRTWTAYWSEEFQRITGLQPGSSDLGAEALMHLIHPDDQAQLRTAVEKAIAGDGVLEADVRLVRPDPADQAELVVALRGTAELDSRGRQIRSLGTIQDVTAQRGLERRLRVSDQRFQLAFDQAPIGMALVSARPADMGTPLQVNQAMCELLGQSEAELLSAPLVPGGPDVTAANLTLRDRVLAGELTSVHHVERQMRHGNGLPVWLSISATLIRDADGRPDYFVSHFVDITERIRSEVAAQEQIEQDRHIATVLQENLLPNVPGQVGPVTVATRYQPAGLGAAVGGDWYDVFGLPDGRIGMTVGDVAGHGIESAAVMARLRYAVRMLAGTGAGPAEVITQLNLAMHDPALLGAEIELATLVHAQLDPWTGRMRYCSAGHPPMVVLPPPRRSDPWPCQPGPTHPPLPGPWLVPTMDNLPIGVTLDPGYQENELLLALGSTVIGFTDGLIERRDATLDDGLAALVATLGALSAQEASAVEEIAAILLHELAPPGQTEDDTAVIVLRLPAEPGSILLPDSPATVIDLADASPHGPAGS